MRNDERGTVLIEFIGSFLLFFLLIISILSLVNIVTAQARVHYALTETANTMSMYGYVMSAASNAPHTASTSAPQAMQDINETLDRLNNFRRNFSGWKQMILPIPAEVKQRDPHYSILAGMQFVGFIIECDMLETYGSYFIYFDDMRIVTDLFPEEDRDDDDMIDAW